MKRKSAARKTECAVINVGGGFWSGEALQTLDGLTAFACLMLYCRF